MTDPRPPSLQAVQTRVAEAGESGSQDRASSSGDQKALVELVIKQLRESGFAKEPESVPPTTIGAGHTTSSSSADHGASKPSDSEHKGTTDLTVIKNENA